MIKHLKTHNITIGAAPPSKRSRIDSMFKTAESEVPDLSMYASSCAKPLLFTTIYMKAGIGIYHFVGDAGIAAIVLRKPVLSENCKTTAQHNALNGIIHTGFHDLTFCKLKDRIDMLFKFLKTKLDELLHDNPASMTLDGGKVLNLG